MYKEKTVNGMIFYDGCGYMKKITVRATKNKIGKSISLCDDEKDIMIIVPVEQIEELINTVLRDEK